MPRKKQTESAPWFLQLPGQREEVTVKVKAPIKASLDDYLRWASRAAQGLEPAEVEGQFWDRVIEDAIRRDKAYKASKAGSKEGPGAPKN